MDLCDSNRFDGSVVHSPNTDRTGDGIDMTGIRYVVMSSTPLIVPARQSSVSTANSLPRSIDSMGVSVAVADQRGADELTVSIIFK